MTHRAERWRHLADLINARAKQLGLDQAELARRARLSDPTIRELTVHPIVIRDRRSVGMRRLCVALGWTPSSIEDVLGGGEPTDAVPDAPDQWLAVMGAVEFTPTRAIEYIEARLSELTVSRLDDLARRVEALERAAEVGTVERIDELRDVVERQHRGPGSTAADG